MNPVDPFTTYQRSQQHNIPRQLVEVADLSTGLRGDKPSALGGHILSSTRVDGRLSVGVELARVGPGAKLWS